MASVTIRHLDDETKRRLRIRAAQNGRSMEEEARAILRTATAAEPFAQRGLGSAIRARVAELGGVELDLPPREPLREPDSFG